MTDITAKPFDWDDNLSKEALEDFEGIRKDLPYCTCQNIGMALAKLELLEKQGQKLKIGHWIVEDFTGLIRCDRCNGCAYMDVTSGEQCKSRYCPECGAYMWAEIAEGSDKE